MYWEDSGSWKIDINIPMMINALKISCIPFNIRDGTIENKDLRSDQIKNRLKSIPTFIEYIGYILFPPTAIIGPFFEYKIYHNYIYNLEDFSKEVGHAMNDCPVKIMDDTIFSPKTKFYTVLQRTIKAIVYAVVYAICQKHFDYTVFFELREFKFKEFLSVLFAYTIVFRYIVGWMFSEAHLALCGISYSKEKNNYEGIKLVNDINVIFFPDPSTIFQVSYMLILLRTGI